jgi:amino acid transporter
MVSMAITICLSFINIGSTAALSAIFSVSNGSLVSSYIVTISCMIWRRFHSPLPPARFSLGKYGLFLNIVSICFLLPIFVFSFFPSTSRPTLASMNWGVVIYCSVIIFSTLHYHFGGGRQSYQPPNENIKEAIEAGDQFYANSEERGMGDTGARLIGHYLDQKQR